MLGYAANIRVGAITYNAVHTYAGPLQCGHTRIRSLLSDTSGDMSRSIPSEWMK